MTHSGVKSIQTNHLHDLYIITDFQSPLQQHIQDMGVGGMCSHKERLHLVSPCQTLTISVHLDKGICDIKDSSFEHRTLTSSDSVGAAVIAVI